MNKNKIPLLALCIAALKMGHDSGQSKIWFILAMAISAYAVSGDWIATVVFLLPLAIYVIDTGNYHKANLKNKAIDKFKNTFLIEKQIDKQALKLVGKAPASAYYFEEWEDDIRHTKGFIYCLLCVGTFALPFIYTNALYALPLFVWPFIVRHCHWWAATGFLFGVYSLMYFWSL
jgi:hypothetical protein